MPLRMLFKYLANNEHLVQKLAESYPVRRAAQLCVSLFYRSQNIAKDKIPPINKIDLTSFLKHFKQDIAKGLKEAREQIKNNEQKYK